MKKLILFSLIFLLVSVSTVIAFDESLIKVPITVKWDVDNKNTARIIIEGENLQWSKTISYNNTINNATNQSAGLPSGWVENLEIIIIQKFGNYTDVQYAIEECSKAINFTQEWKECVELNNKLDLMMINKMVNKSIYENMKQNLTTNINTWESKYRTEMDGKETTIKTLTDENEELTTWKTRWQWIGVAALIGCLYLANRFLGWGKRKQAEETEESTDVGI